MKVLKQNDKPQFKHVYGNDEYHLKKFASKDARAQFLKLLQDAINARKWMQELKSEEVQKME